MRNELLRHLRKRGSYLKREGGAHSLWINPTTGQSKRFHVIRKLQISLPKRSAATFQSQNPSSFKSAE